MQNSSSSNHSRRNSSCGYVAIAMQNSSSPIHSPEVADRSIFYLLWLSLWRFLSIHFLGNVLFFLWIPVWYLDELFKIPVEWVLISMLSLFLFIKINMVSLFFEVKRITKFIWVCVLVFPLFSIYYLVPIIYLPRLVNALIHFISFLGIIISDYKLSQKEKSKKRSFSPASFGEYVIGTFFFFFFFIYMDYFKRDLLARFLVAETSSGFRFYFALFTFVCCIFFLFVFILPTLLLGLKNILERERKQRQQNADPPCDNSSESASLQRPSAVVASTIKSGEVGSTSMQKGNKDKARTKQDTVVRDEGRAKKQKSKDADETERKERASSEKREKKRRKKERPKEKEKTEANKNESKMREDSQPPPSGTRSGDNFGCREKSGEEEMEETIDFDLEALEHLQLGSGLPNHIEEESQDDVLPTAEANGDASLLPLPKELACFYCGRKGRSNQEQAVQSQVKTKGKRGKKKRDKQSSLVADLKMCGGCKAAFYCDVHCQAQDWPTHAQHCSSFT